MVNKKIFNPRIKAYPMLIALSVLFCLQHVSCKKQQDEPKPEIRDYYDPYAPSIKSKFDSVKTAQTLLAQTSGIDSMQLFTEKSIKNEHQQ